MLRYLVVDAILPSFGPEAGGTVVTVSGARLDSIQEIIFDAVCGATCLQNQPSSFFFPRVDFIDA